MRRDRRSSRRVRPAHFVDSSLVSYFYRRGIGVEEKGRGGIYRPVKVLAGSNVEYTATDSKVDGGVVLAVEGEESGRGEGAEDDGGRTLGEADGGFGTKLEVDEDDEEGEEDEVYGGGDCHPLYIISDYVLVHWKWFCCL